ncbi:MAG: hypothetical protein K0R50_34 [Eubacterium sp.]|jgi:hypothetical protein|nr:hypothetical protein [Eubacterium sp.]
MYTIEYNRAKNRIYVSVEGALQLEEMPEYNKKFNAAVDSAKQGFTVCVDNTKASINSAEVSEKLDISKAYAASHGMRNAAMVLNSTVFKMQMKRLFKELGNVFESVEAADVFLDTAPDFKDQ